MLIKLKSWGWFFAKIFICLFFVFFMIPKCQSGEVQALMQIKSALQVSNSLVFDKWTPENSPCNFSGIICNSNQKVQEIDLSSQNISGIVLFDLICSLESLEKLSLGSNFLYGSISDHLSNCTSLQYLDLGLNSFSGEVPDLSSLTKLEFLNLNGSDFSGPFPWKSLENLTNLTFLSIGDNPFEKGPFPLELFKLDKLYWLYLTNCSIEGQIPEGLGNLTLLENLELSNNYLFGKIPNAITKLTRLHQLELYSNSLSGKIPVGFGNLTNLVNFDVSTNNLEGDISELKTLVHLESLQLFENRFSGGIPPEFGDFRFLKELSLYTNNFTGPLPQKIGSWAEFIYIDASENLLSGPIPPDMCKQGKFVDLLLLQNSFTGGIPETYANCSSLNRLRVSNNSLSGRIPIGIWSLPNVNIIDLNLNQFEGPLTEDIGDAKSLAQLLLANNLFSGELPKRISEASSLVAINVSSNKFSGEIPSTIGKLQQLGNLHLEYNLFSGAIPDSLGSCISLNDVNLAANQLSGIIPGRLGLLPSLNFLNLSNNELSGGIPASLSSLRLSLLDLSNNRLVGNIPDALSMEASNGSFTGNPSLCSSSLRGFRPCSRLSDSSKGIKWIISCIVAGVCVSIIALIFCLCVKLKHKNEGIPIKRVDNWDMKQFQAVSFGEEHILNSLKHENLIGKGGSGDVYKLVLENGDQFAVKHIWNSNSGYPNSCKSSTPILSRGTSRSKEHDSEVKILSSIRHMNVVKLYCSISNEDTNLLVYEYLTNGSLWDHLHSGQNAKMDWIVRYDIALGAARGLEYLHHCCYRPIVHRDVTSSNILLDENMKPKIADFGLAKFIQAQNAMDQSTSTHIVAGTPGYMAPEYAFAYKVNEKSDVYSFGVVLMELVSGRRPVEAEFGDNKDIVQWICSKLRSNCEETDLVDHRISDGMKEEAAKVLRIAIHCTTGFPALRPPMRNVVQMLENVHPAYR